MMAIDISTSLGTTKSPDKAEVELLSMIGSIAAFSILSLALNLSLRARDLLVRAAIRSRARGKLVVNFVNIIWAGRNLEKLLSWSRAATFPSCRPDRVRN